MSRTNVVAVSRFMFKFLNITNYPLIFMLAMLTVQLVFGRFIGFAGALGRSTGLIAILCFLFGLLLLAASVVQLHCYKTTINPSRNPKRLITFGLFRWSRNPMYVGMLLILLVQPLLSLRPHLFVFALIFFLVMNYIIIPREERTIEMIFGEEYRTYQARVRRWL